jgi:CheY-like chemotaxis protein
MTGKVPAFCSLDNRFFEIVRPRTPNYDRSQSTGGDGFYAAAAVRARTTVASTSHKVTSFCAISYTLSCIYTSSPTEDYRGAFSMSVAATSLRTLPTIEPKARVAKPVILCVEDGPTYLALRKRVLERDGYNVIGVTTVADALKTLREAPVCATIADHMLYGKAGADFAKKMKSIKPDVPIILFSGTYPENLESIDVFIQKGEPTAKLLNVLRDVVERFCS